MRKDESRVEQRLAERKERIQVSVPGAHIVRFFKFRSSASDFPSLFRCTSL